MERNGIELDARTNQERTPLHMAASRGHSQICKLLIEKQLPRQSVVMQQPVGEADGNGEQGQIVEEKKQEEESKD